VRISVRIAELLLSSLLHLFPATTTRILIAPFARRSAFGHSNFATAAPYCQYEHTTRSDMAAFLIFLTSSILGQSRNLPVFSIRDK